MIFEGKEEYAERLDQNVMFELNRYLETGDIYDGFLYALLTNDLMLTYIKADDFNKENVYNYVNYLYNYVGRDAWGSVENVKRYSSRMKNG